MDLRNESARKRLYRRDRLFRLAEGIYAGEGGRGNAELSLLFCDDTFIVSLNRQYRKKNQATDVLSFGQGPPPDDSRLNVLGDIVISLETVEKNCGGDRALMREEVLLLFCHGLLHLLGHDHHTARERKSMISKQACYLGVSEEAAWRFGPQPKAASGARNAQKGGL